VDAATCLVDLADVAEVAALVLTQTGHIGATYELVGTELITPQEIAQAISRYIDREVTAKVVPLDVWEKNARSSGLDGYPLDALLKMFRYNQPYGLRGNANVLTWLLGHSPTSLGQFLQRDTDLTAAD